MGITKSRSVPINPRSEGRGIGSTSKMSKVGEIEAKDGVLGGDDIDPEVMDEDVLRKDKLDTERARHLGKKYTKDTDIRDIAPEDRADYLRLVKNKSENTIKGSGKLSGTYSSGGTYNSKSSDKPDYIKNSEADDQYPEMRFDGGSYDGFVGDKASQLRMSGPVKGLKTPDSDEKAKSQNESNATELREGVSSSGGKEQYSPEELQQRLDEVRRARKAAAKKGKQLTPAEQEEIFRKELPKKVTQEAAKLQKQVAALRAKEDFKITNDKDYEPSELSDKEVAALIQKHRKLFNRQKQLSDEQRQEEYPDPIKPLEQYDSIGELNHAMLKYQTKEEKRQLQQRAIRKGSKTLTEFTGKEDGAEYELVQASNADALAEHAKGSHWCVQNPDTGKIYLSDSEAGSFYILKKNGKPLVAIRKNADNVDNIKKMGGNAEPGAVEVHHFIDQDMVSGKGYSDYGAGVDMSEDDLAATREAMDKLGFGDVNFKLPVYSYKNNEALKQKLAKSLERGNLVEIDRLLFTTEMDLDDEQMKQLLKANFLLGQKYVESKKIDTSEIFKDRKFADEMFNGILKDLQGLNRKNIFKDIAIEMDEKALALIEKMDLSSDQIVKLAKLSMPMAESYAAERQIDLDKVYAPVYGGIKLSLPALNSLSYRGFDFEAKGLEARKEMLNDALTAMENQNYEEGFRGLDTYYFAAEDLRATFKGNDKVLMERWSDMENAILQKNAIFKSGAMWDANYNNYSLSAYVKRLFGDEFVNGRWNLDKADSNGMELALSSGSETRGLVFKALNGKRNGAVEGVLNNMLSRAKDVDKDAVEYVVESMLDYVKASGMSLDEVPQDWRDAAKKVV